MIVRTVFLCKKRDAMVRDKIQKMTVDKVIQRLPRGLNQKGLIKKTIANQNMKISLKTPHKRKYSIKDMAIHMHECNVLGKFIIYKLGMFSLYVFYSANFFLALSHCQNKPF
jgi:hypothetical protein